MPGLPGIIALGVYFRANLTEFRESAKPVLDNETALLRRHRAAAGFAGAEKLYGKIKPAVCLSEPQRITRGSLKTVRRGLARAGDIPSALSEISSARSKLDDLWA